MSFNCRRILCPVNFDENSAVAVDLAAALARQNDAIVYLFHVVPTLIQQTGAPNYLNICKGREEEARKNLQEIAHRHLGGVKSEVATELGEPATAIVSGAREYKADLIVMATHGRRGFKRFMLGSVAEIVIREAKCPVLTTHGRNEKPDEVAHWMARNPVVAGPDEKLSALTERMFEGSFRMLPIVEHEVLVGIVTDRDIRSHTGEWDRTTAKQAMTEAVVTVTSETSVQEAARLLRERKIGGLPVLEHGRLAGVISVSDVLEALTHGEQLGTGGRCSEREDD